MNEPKRRGRPPKATTDEKLAAAKSLALNGAEIRKDLGRALAQAYALRVWNGQSPDVPRNERIRRVKLALEGQNLPFEGVELP